MWKKSAFVVCNLSSSSSASGSLERKHFPSNLNSARLIFSVPSSWKVCPKTRKSRKPVGHSKKKSISLWVMPPILGLNSEKKTTDKNFDYQNYPKQDYIPAGCVPPACWPYPLHREGGLPRRGVWPGGIVCQWRVLLGGCLAGGVVCPASNVSQHAMGQTSPALWTHRHV